jgi:LytS/YehU family sensor histidine kinase
VAEGKVVGVIDSEHPRKHFFTRGHLNLLQTIASITATKIQRARGDMAVEEKERRLADLRLQVAHTRQQALRAQMNPHFIFNCLNSINGFILQNDAATASTFLIKFSKLIRLILEHSNEKTIPLQSELDALKLYIEMEALRFGKKFSYRIDVAPDVQPGALDVPPLILQPFVENSIWHGLLHKEAGGHLEVRVNRRNGLLECIIEDNGIGRKASQANKPATPTHRKSLGMRLTGERLALLNEQKKTGSAVEVVDLEDAAGKAAGTRVILSMPILNDLS